MTMTEPRRGREELIRAIIAEHNARLEAWLRNRVESGSNLETWKLEQRYEFGTEFECSTVKITTRLVPRHPIDNRRDENG
jgi:hypothetical protein